MKKWLGFSLALVMVGLVVVLWPAAKPIDSAAPVIAETTAEPAQNPSIAAAPAAAATLTVTEQIAVGLPQQFAYIAVAYEQELSYPPYSRPLSREDVQLLAPNHYVVQQVPLEGGASAAIVVPQYRFIYPEAIDVALAVTGVDASQVMVSLFSEETGQILTESAMPASEQGFSTLLTADQDWQGELRLEVAFRANGQLHRLHTGIEYQQPSAEIIGVADGYAEGTDLVIPLQLEVSAAGTYRVRANLFSQDGEPLAHLVSSAHLAEGEATLLLRAYKAVLAGKEGPYLLNTFTVERRSAAPGERSRFGKSAQAEYQVEFYGLGLLSDEPWQPDASELQRLQFLQQMAEVK
ncbi:hypothetical protein ACO1PK_13195 [Alishewanella sp. d11]|uniref:hypothetical protein n=1 Tax=Alishewanella sp. d11 TaxID=3414030 RepID=UPI003BF7FE47